MIKINHANEKKHIRTSPDVQFKEFSLTKHKTRPRTNYGWIGKTISKKNQIKKIKKKQKNDVEMKHVNKKNHKREMTIWFEQKKTRPRMNYELIGRTIYKKIRYEKSKKL